MKQSPALSKVARGDLCAGCGGCALVAPDAVTMEMTPPGYLRPRQTGPVAAEAEAKIAALCPGLGQSVAAEGRQDDPLWGPYQEMRTGHATNADLRYHGSSGGVLSAVMNYLVTSGKVDGAIQTTADPEVPVANIATISVDLAGVQAAAGSRYAPSAPLASLGPVLEGDRTYAFVGKPCDAAALRALAKLDPRVDQRIPYVLSFFCAGVPSQTGAEAVLGKLGTDLASTKSFRYRGQGWPGFATATDHAGTERQMSYHDSWGKVLSRHVQHRCKVCADGTGVAADLVCADCWDTDERGYPLFEEQDGTSLVVARNAAGRALMAEVEAAGHIVTDTFDVPKLTNIQTGQRHRRYALFARLAGLIVTGRPIPQYQGLLIRAAARRNSLKDNLKNFLGMVRRSLKARLKRAD